MKLKKTIQIIAFSAIASALFVGCGDSSDSAPATATVETGTFVDAPVQGLKYVTASQNGDTNANGEFKYVAGEEVEFFLGNLSLGKAAAEALMTPYTLSGSNTQMATNIALLVQNFDNDRTDAILNVLALKDYNLSDFHISDTNLESKLTTLLATPDFQTRRGGTNFGLIDSTTAKNAMDTFIATDSIKYDKKFTQAYLDAIVFYKTSDEYPQYKNKYYNGYVYFAGDEDNGLGWNDNFSTATSTYTIVNGVINASFDNGDNVTLEITEVTEDYLVVTGKLGSDIRTQKWYTSKEAAIANTFTVQYGFGAEWLKANKLYMDNGIYFDFVDGINTAHNADGTQVLISAGDVQTNIPLGGS